MYFQKSVCILSQGVIRQQGLFFWEKRVYPVEKGEEGL
ncbi:hypothetical protein HMPREF9124_1736 [Oribacterium sp. oral taxon 108 str. F0425]|nr:hypothetical protein HMPREF9124_1736 [Oribacterium sp. oral taxon 108 str. F0425]